MLYRLSNLHFINKRTSLACALLFVATLALLTTSTSAHAQCKQWYVGGMWDIQQSNGFHLYLELHQTGNTIEGTASEGRVTGGTKVLGVQVEGGDPVTRTYDVKGNIEGDDFFVTIGTAGIYRGKIGSSGRIDGTTYDKDHPSNQATWFSGRAMACGPPTPSGLGMAGPATPRPAPPPPLKATGKTPKSEPAPAPLKAPGIIASQVVFEVPFQPSGFAILTWDAGSDHPHAAVWVKVNNGAPTLAFKGMKGGSRVNVARGRSYAYLLKDGSKTLATVSFTVP